MNRPATPTAAHPVRVLASPPHAASITWWTLWDTTGPLEPDHGEERREPAPVGCSTGNVEPRRVTPRAPAARRVFHGKRLGMREFFLRSLLEA